MVRLQHSFISFVVIMTIFGKILIPFDYYLGFIKYLAKLRAYFGINFYVIREIFIMPNGQIYEKLRYCQLVTTDLVIVVVTVNVVVVDRRRRRRRCWRRRRRRHQHRRECRSRLS